MKKIHHFLACLVLACMASTAFGQTSVNELAFTSKSAINKILEADDWAFQSAESKTTYYVDFQEIKFNIAEVAVKNAEGMVVFKEDVSGLPANAIYELDLKPLGKGALTIELRSFTHSIQKTVTVE
jgi:hypothetical protein